MKLKVGVLVLSFLLVLFLLLSMTFVPIGECASAVTLGNSSTDYSLNGVAGIMRTRKTWRMSGRYWVIYANGKNMVCNSSTDGVTWDVSEIVRAGATERGYFIAVGYNLTHFAYVWMDNTFGASLKYRLGTCLANGSLSWVATEQHVGSMGGTISSGYPSVAFDSNGFVMFGMRTFNGATNISAWAWRNTMKDGTWTNQTGFPFHLDTETAQTKDYWVDVVALSNGYVGFTYFNYYSLKGYFRYYDSADATWSVQLQPVNDTKAYYPEQSTCLLDDSIHLVYLDSSDDISYMNYTFSINRWGAKYTLNNTCSGGGVCHPTITAFKSNGTLCVFWEDTKMVFMSFWDKLTWSTVRFVDAETFHSTDHLTAIFDDQVDGHCGLVWVGQASAPYNIRYATFLAGDFIRYLMTLYYGVGTNQIRVNGTIYANGSTLDFGLFANWTVILESAGQGGNSYAFNNWTYNGNTNISNPFYLVCSQNFTVWSYYQAVVAATYAVARFDFNPTNPAPGDHVVFNATQSYNTTDVAFNWDFGDGNITLVSDSFLVLHSFPANTTYIVSLELHGTATAVNSTMFFRSVNVTTASGGGLSRTEPEDLASLVIAGFIGVVLLIGLIVIVTRGRRK